VVVHALIFSQSGLIWRRHEVPPSCRCHGTCLNINFHETGGCGESYVGYDRWLVIVERVLVAMKTMRHMFSLCVSVWKLLVALASGGGSIGGVHSWW
jgi:hypothetical protein